MMAHYAYINKETNKVEMVIVGKDESLLIDGLDTETYYEQNTPYMVKRTSYNNNYRYNYAGIGYYFDEDLDAFIPPKCHKEAVLNAKCLWDCSNSEHDITFS
jgi:hypothetical protein